jgi:hypothetical protein
MELGPFGRSEADTVGATRTGAAKVTILFPHGIFLLSVVVSHRTILTGKHLLNFRLINVHHIGNSTDLGGFAGQGGDVIAREMA